MYDFEMNRFASDLKHDIKDDCMRSNCMWGVMKDDCMPRYECNAAFPTKAMCVHDDETNNNKRIVARTGGRRTQGFVRLHQMQPHTLDVLHEPINHVVALCLVRIVLCRNQLRATILSFPNFKVKLTSMANISAFSIVSVSWLNAFGPRSDKRCTSRIWSRTFSASLVVLHNWTYL